MARARSPARDKAFEIWKQHKGEITNRAIAEQLDVSEKTIGGWKSKDNWNTESNGVLQKKIRSTPKEPEKGKTSSSKAVRGKRSGNPNPKNQFSHRNNPKLLHGLRSKFFHEEQVEIMEAIAEASFEDQLWLQIEIKFSAIIRMQKIMWVEDSKDHLKELSGESTNEFGGSETYKIAFAYERFESYIKAQTRAMAEYRNLVKQFCEMAHDEDERRLKLDQMQLNIEKTKAEIEKISNDGRDEGPIEIIISSKKSK